ncbi:MAG TPA: M15 family metallopeptidase [Micropruina sp.]|nr:M15 family metallopeptidase [Micropruina sp.]
MSGPQLRGLSPATFTRTLTAAALTVALVGCAAAAPGAGPSSEPAGSSSPTLSARASATATPSATAGSPTASTSTPAASRSATPSTTADAPKDTRTAAKRNRAFMVNGIPVISKTHPINADYRRSSVTSPNGLTTQAQTALTRMIAAARAAGVTIRVRSGYRSYALQAQILASKIKEYGSETKARRYNAAPGRSEHQTGLAVDLWDGVTWGVGVRSTKVGKWLWANAWRYGFILRYPDGKEKITGYAFEPWHYRWIGTADAKHFGANNTLTLEEYLGLA